MSKIALPSFFSVSRAIQYSDGLLLGLKQDGSTIPLPICDFSVRGAKSSHGDAYKLSSKDVKVSKDINTPNPQKVNGAFLDFETDRLRLSYSVNFHAVSLERQASNDFSYSEKVKDFLTAFSAQSGFKTIAELLVWRIASGAALWRNYAGVNRRVSIRGEGKTWTFDADKLNTKTPCGFDQTPDLVALIEAALSGKREVLMLMVDTDITIGQGQEVFPSQELEMKKEKNAPSKILYSVPYRGTLTAAMHPQKIGAAIRAFDLWHPVVDKTGPLSIEPLGYSHQHQQSFRTPANGTDLYSYLQNIDELTSQLQAGKLSNEACYVAACFIRGGVFSGSADESEKAAKKSAKSKKTDQADVERPPIES